MSAGGDPKIELRRLCIRYGGRRAVHDVTLSVPANAIFAWIGPAGSGKTSILRTINLISVDVDHAEVEGRILLDGQDVLEGHVDRERLRRRVGMVFATPQPLPGSIRENLAFGPRLSGVRDPRRLAQIAEESLVAAQLWDEVRDRLDGSALALSGGQQQRLCIARTIALGPEVILLDEPCSGLDPISTSRIEEMMRSLASRFTWVIVTNNTKQAARIGDRTAFFLQGELVEEGPTARILGAPRDARTRDYLEGRFG